MKRAWLMAFVWVAATAAAQGNNPAFNATGVWVSAGGGVVQIFQMNKKVTAIFVGPDFAHRYEAQYSDPKHFGGTQVRVTRATGCTTNMSIRLEMLSPDLISVSATALDSNCDLVQGQTYVDTNYRMN